MPLPICRGYLNQILSGLEECHRIKIVHCDLKPENVLIVPKDRTRVKLIDFGSSCIEGHQKYEYIQSRFYRAPEVILGMPYGPPMDIWSAVLIFIEVLIGCPLFPGNDELEVLVFIATVLGPPPAHLLRRAKRTREFFDEGNCLRGSFAKSKLPGSAPIETVLHSEDPRMIDFVRNCLTWDQAERMSACQCLQHPFMLGSDFEIPGKDTKPSLPPIHP